MLYCLGKIDFKAIRSISQDKLENLTFLRRQPTHVRQVASLAGVGVDEWCGLSGDWETRGLCVEVLSDIILMITAFFPVKFVE